MILKLIKIRSVVTVLSLLAYSLVIDAQNDKLLSGKISYNGKPVSDVSVSVEGVQIDPVYSDSLGQFVLQLPSSQLWITVQPVEVYKTQRIFVDDRSNLNIRLVKLDFNSGNDKVFTIYGEKERRNIISAFSTINTNDITDSYVESADQFLQGKVSGLNVINHSGMPGAGAYSLLRGMKSIYTGSQPLFIVDGMPLEGSSAFLSMFEGFNDNPLASVNPMDITNITLFKDAGTEALYGSKGSGGVVYIQTLKPDKTITTIDFRSTWGSALRQESIPLLNSGQFRTYANELVMSGQLIDEEYLSEIQVFANNPELDDYSRYSNSTNWQDEVYRNAFLQDYHVIIRGGDAIAKYGLSLGYTAYDGTIRNTDYDRYTLRMVGAFNIFEWLRMDLSSSFSLSSSSIMETGFASQTSPFSTALFKAPFYAPYKFDESGAQLKYLDEAYDDPFQVSNPTALINGFEGSAQTHKLMTTANLEADLMKNLMWSTLLGVNLNRKRETKFVPSTGIVQTGEIYNYSEAAQNHYNAMFVDSRLNFKKQRCLHSLTAVTGFRIHTNNFEYDLGVGRNMHPSNQLKSIQNGIVSLNSIGGDYGVWNWMSGYANVNYAFKDKYLFNVSSSIDGSSRTGADSDYDLDFLRAHSGVFYALQGAWRLSGESMLKNVKWMDDLKLRVSTGKVGNDDIGNYSSKTYYQSIPYRKVIGLVSEIVPNTALKYEEIYENVVGIDVSLFGQRLHLNADYYTITTKDLLVYNALPVWYGVDYMPKNAGEMNTKGWELNMASRVLDGSFKLDIGLNLAAASTKMTSVHGDSMIIEIPGGSKAYIEGEKAGVFWGWKTDGIYKTAEEALADAYLNKLDQPFVGGDVRFVNASAKDNVIDEDDRMIIGDPTPDLYGGFFLNAGWNNWSLDTYFQFSLGNDVFNYMRYMQESVSDFDNQSTRVLNRWISEGDITDVPRANYGDPMGNARFSDRWIEDGSYLRLKNITLNYTFSDVKFVKSANIFVTAQNVLTLSRYLGYDPEFAYSNSELYQGADYGLSPQNKRFLIGIKLGL